MDALIPKALVERLLDVEKLKYCYECGICTASCPVVELLGGYNPRGLLERAPLNFEGVLGSEELWLCAWCYSCYKRCPQALKLPEIFLFMRKAAVEHGLLEPFKRALRRIVQNVPLPLTTTLICFHPERAGLDVREVLEEVEQVREEHAREASVTKVFNGRVAVIGSGPAGLTVAHRLIRAGCDVTVFESLPEPGGMLRKCVPDYRLPKHVLTKDVKSLENLGVEIRTNVTVGKDLNFGDLWAEGYDAVFVGAGAHKSQKMEIEGLGLRGVVHALDFLQDINSGERVSLGNDVVVIGGGNVAIDVARTALKLGARGVTVLYRRSRDEMPASPWEVNEAEGEGVNIEFLVSPKRILGVCGKVSAIECIRMQLGEIDETGRRKPVPIEGSEFTREADTVVLAIGETPDLWFLPEDVELNEDGTAWVDPITMETSLKGVFAGGDAVTGPSTVIEAMRTGRRAAESILSHLKSLKG